MWIIETMNKEKLGFVFIFLAFSAQYTTFGVYLPSTSINLSPDRSCQLRNSHICPDDEYCDAGYCRKSSCIVHSDCAPREQCSGGKCRAQCAECSSNAVTNSNQSSVLGSAIFEEEFPKYRDGTQYQAFGGGTCNPAGPMDIVFMVDESSSMGPENFQKIKDFIGSVTDEFNIERGLIQVSNVVYSDRDNVHLLDDCSFTTNRGHLRQVMDSFKYSGGLTATGEALNRVGTDVFHEECGMRQNSKKAIILITDGDTNNGVQPFGPAKQLRDNGVSIFSVGILCSFSYLPFWQRLGQTLEAISGPNGQAFRALSFEHLKNQIKDQLVSAVCSSPQKDIQGYFPYPTDRPSVTFTRQYPPYPTGQYPPYPTRAPPIGNTINTFPTRQYPPYPTYAPPIGNPTKTFPVYPSYPPNEIYPPQGATTKKYPPYPLYPGDRTYPPQIGANTKDIYPYPQRPQYPNYPLPKVSTIKYPPQPSFQPVGPGATTEKFPQYPIYPPYPTYPIPGIKTVDYPPYQPLNTQPYPGYPNYPPIGSLPGQPVQCPRCPPCQYPQYSPYPPYPPRPPYPTYPPQPRTTYRTYPPRPQTTYPTYPPRPQTTFLTYPPRPQTTFPTYPPRPQTTYRTFPPAPTTRRPIQTPTFPTMATTTTPTTTVDDKKCPVDNIKLDIAFVVDHSSSVGTKNFGKMTNFIGDMFDTLNVDSGQVKVAMVPYSTKPFRVTGLNKYNTNAELRNGLEKTNYKRGRTATGIALETVRDKIFAPGKGSRPDAHKVTVVITDGVSNTGVKPGIPAGELINDGVEVFAVGIKGASRDELDSIAKKKENVVEIADFDDLKNDLSLKIIKSVCDSLKNKPVP